MIETSVLMRLYHFPHRFLNWNVYIPYSVIHIAGKVVSFPHTRLKM